VEHIRAVARAAAAGEHARIRIKVNNLTDPAIIEELYAASQAGAEIDLIVRAICMLRPGVEGLSERIRVRSILGRFLEHSRLFCFEAGETKTFLLGSADLMERNLDHRIEVIVPVESALVRAEIEAVLRSLLADNSQAWELGADGIWERQHPQGTERRRAAQVTAMRRRTRSRRSGQPG
jgi:polyphosphate kinase